MQPGAVESTTPRMYICVLYVSSQVEGGSQKQHKHPPHNRLAISCHLETMQTVLKLVVLLSTQPNNKGMTMMNKVQRTPLKMYNNKVNKCTTNSYIYIYT
jgi:hypothetical protein